MNLKAAFFTLICLGLFSIFSNSSAQENRVYIDENLLLSHLELYIHNDNWVIFDRRQQRILLIDPADGSLIREIHSDNIHPGFNWMPIAIRPLNDAIFVVNPVPFGFYIGYENEFLNELGMHFEATATLFFTDNYLFGFYVNMDYTPEVRIMDKEGNLIHSFDVELTFPVLDYRMEELILHPYKDQIIVGSPNQNTVGFYNIDGTRTKQITIQSDYFRLPSRDLSRTSNVSEMMQDFFRIKENTSNVMASFMVSEKELLLYITHQKYEIFEFILIDLESEKQYSFTQPYQEDGYLTLAKDGKLYFSWEQEKTYIEIKTLSDIFSSYP